jgi:ribosomal protein S18 acetylase RimI-like enzyme
LSPFIRPLTLGDLRQIVPLHLAAFERFYLTGLGSSFLREYYRQAILHQGSICLGLFEGSHLRGLAVGFVDPPAFYRALRAARLRLGLAALPALVKAPGKLRRFVVNYKRTAASSREGAGAREAELASLAVCPNCGGRGFGSRLVREFAAESGRRRAAAVTLTTDAVGNDEVNAFYEKVGFEFIERFEAQPGRWLNRHVMRTAPAGRPDA